MQPGSTIDFMVDGITHPNFPAQVFKAVDYIDLIFGINVTPNFIYVNTSEGIELNQLGGGGWMNQPPDPGWNAIFEKAGWKPK
jgi:hypothetical protein